MVNKAQLISEIQQINRSADREWLARFDLQALRRYLEHLQQTLEPRGSESFWLRLAETPAVVTRRAAG